MSSLDEMVQCPWCNVSVRWRDLHSRPAGSGEILSCRKCGLLVEFNVQSEAREAGYIFFEDVTEIGGWLDSVVEKFGFRVEKQKDRQIVDPVDALLGGAPVEKPNDRGAPGPTAVGVFIWSIDGLTVPWRCEVVYDKERPHVVEVRLCVDVAGAESFPAADVLTAACASHCVQPTGAKLGREMGTKGKAWWGTTQLLGTGWLPPSLFHAVVARLDEAIRAVAPK